jgi:acetylornithine deacetylase
MRLLPGLSATDVRAELSRRVATVAERRGLDWFVEPLFESIPPAETPAGSAIVRVAEGLTGHVAEAVNFGTEAPFLNQLGMETIVLNRPGRIIACCIQPIKPDEYLFLDEIRQV